jgi:hypothetical protein
MKMVHYYRGKKKNEVPPHLYLVADTAYSCMTRGKTNINLNPFFLFICLLLLLLITKIVRINLC